MIKNYHTFVNGEYTQVDSRKEIAFSVMKKDIPSLKMHYLNFTELKNDKDKKTKLTSISKTLADLDLRELEDYKSHTYLIITDDLSIDTVVVMHDMIGKSSGIYNYLYYIDRDKIGKTEFDFECSEEVISIRNTINFIKSRELLDNGFSRELTEELDFLINQMSTNFDDIMKHLVIDNSTKFSENDIKIVKDICKIDIKELITKYRGAIASKNYGI